MPAGRLVDVHGALEHLGPAFTEKQLRDLVYRRHIPFVKVNRRLLFDLRQIDKWIEQHTVPVEAAS